MKGFEKIMKVSFEVFDVCVGVVLFEDTGPCDEFLDRYPQVTVVFVLWLSG